MAVHVTDDGSVRTVVLDRPEVRGAVDGEHAKALREAFEEFEERDDLSVGVLTGSAGHFCAGADLKAVSSGAMPVFDPGAGPGPMGPTRLKLSKPVIAAVEGHAVAGGLELAVWCDLRVASETAVFGVYCRRWGVPLIDGGTVRLARILGQGRAMDLIVTGRGVDAQEALQIGLANRVTEQGKALETAQRWAAEIAALPQLCLRHDRLSLLEQWGLDEDAAIANEWQHGLASLSQGVGGAARFVSGEGRHGS
ncbi:MAG: crotonase/enoyl-CoA hydratase family protein [Frankiales bacterium]|jgi:enoyl-CoA hydratase|nr:crotonase/enoyl-CoA hydratase family protein [Frankiales bacterium]